MVVSGKDNDDPVGIKKKPAAMPTIDALLKILEGLNEKEEIEKLPRCPCPYWLKDKHIFVHKHLNASLEKCE